MAVQDIDLKIDRIVDDSRASYRLPSILFRLGLCFLLLTGGCQKWQQRGAKGSGLLPKAAGDEKNFSSFQPSNPFVQTAPGLLSRKVFDAPGPAGMHIEVQDLLVGPAQRAENVKLMGTVVSDVRSGSGVVIIDGQRQQVRPGSTFTIADGKSFTVENTTGEAIQIRIYVIRAE